MTQISCLIRTTKKCVHYRILLLTRYKGQCSICHKYSIVNVVSGFKRWTDYHTNSCHPLPSYVYRCHLMSTGAHSQKLEEQFIGTTSHTSPQYFEAPLIPDQYPNLFTGLGTFNQEYTIQLKDDVVPHALAIFSPRKVPHALREQVK